MAHRQHMTQQNSMHTPTAHRIRRQMTALRSLPLMAALSLVLLFAQAVEHGHSHAADLQSQFDCEICLKVGSLDAIAVAAAPSEVSLTPDSAYALPIQNYSSSKPARATARAPPAHA